MEIHLARPTPRISRPVAGHASSEKFWATKKRSENLEEFGGFENSEDPLFQ